MCSQIRLNIESLKSQNAAFYVNTWCSAWVGFYTCYDLYHVLVTARLNRVICATRFDIRLYLFLCEWAPEGVVRDRLEIQFLGRHNTSYAVNSCSSSSPFCIAQNRWARWARLWNWVKLFIEAKFWSVFSTPWNDAPKDRKSLQDKLSRLNWIIKHLQMTKAVWNERSEAHCTEHHENRQCAVVV